VCWSDHRGSDLDIYAQRVNGGAAAQWPANGVAVCTQSADQEPARMISDGAGGAILVWQDRRPAGLTSDIYAQRLDASGTPQWGADGKAVCSTPDVQGLPVLTSDDSGGAFFFWSDDRTSIWTEVFAQRFDAAGTPQWAANGVSIVSPPGTTVSLPVSGAVTAGTGEAIVLIHWIRTDIVTSGYFSGLLAQKVNGSGAAQWGSYGTIVCDLIGQCVNEQVLGDGSDGAYVAWSDGRTGVFDIYMQRLDAATGTGMWTFDGNAVCNAASEEHLGGLTRGPSGNAFVTWSDERSGQPDIYAQQIDPSGVDIWAANGVPVCGAARGQFVASLAQMKNASPLRLYTGWTDNRTGDARYVRLQRLDTTGSPQWGPDGVTRTELALVSAEASAERVKLTWHASEAVRAMVYRSAAEGEWLALGEASSDGTGQLEWEDRDVTPGARYGYRLGVTDAGTQSFFGETWVDVPSRLELAMQGFVPNPAGHDVAVSFTLPSRAASQLEVVDVSGRRILARDLSALAPGSHILRLGELHAPAGMYFIRVTHQGRSATARGLIVR
jgi:hypothetical protein